MNLDFSRKLKALADPVRLKILRTLPTKNICKESYNVSELARELGIPQSSVSRHLAVLLHTKLVRNQRMCCDVYYWVDRAELKGILKQLGEIGRKR